MSELSVPISITYNTKGATPISEVIAALQAADAAIQDAISLLPSLFQGLHIESSSINVRSLTQESPLRELFLATLIVAFQKDLTNNMSGVVENLLGVDIPENYDSIVTVVTMIVIFYGAAFIKDAALKMVGDGPVHRQLNGLVEDVAKTTGKSPEEVRKIIKAKYSTPSSIKSLIKTVGRFFTPSHLEGATSITFDRTVVSEDVVRDVPYARDFIAKEDFEKYESHSGVTLQVHAQDKDKNNTGWAAMPLGLCEKRLRMKIQDPVTIDDIWTKEIIVGDITIVSKLTANGYSPYEIHLTKVY